MNENTENNIELETQNFNQNRLLTTQEDNLATEVPLQTQYTNDISEEIPNPTTNEVMPAIILNNPQTILRKKTQKKIEYMINNTNNNMILLAILLLLILFVFNRIINELLFAICILFFEIIIFGKKVKKKVRPSMTNKLKELLSDSNIIDSISRLLSEIIFLFIHLFIKKGYFICSFPLLISAIWVVLIYIFKESDDPYEAEVTISG